MITIIPKGGLCNCLRVVFSWYQYAILQNLELNVIWKKTNECPGFFIDYFEPIPNVHFNKSVEKNVKINYSGGQRHPSHKPLYSKLKLKPYLFNIILNKLNILNKKYISVHIRRTDHIRLAKKVKNYTCDKMFFNFIDKTDNNIYIATDNKHTYNQFKLKYSNRIKFDYHKTINKCLRKTSLQDAIIDIYMCVYSDNFKGSSFSSFSDLIIKLRKYNTLSDLIF